jgi:hypothetical protein
VVVVVVVVVVVEVVDQPPEEVKQTIGHQYPHWSGSLIPPADVSSLTICHWP